MTKLGTCALKGFASSRKFVIVRSPPAPSKLPYLTSCKPTRDIALSPSKPPICSIATTQFKQRICFARLTWRQNHAEVGDHPSFRCFRRHWYLTSNLQFRHVTSVTYLVLTKIKGKNVTRFLLWRGEYLISLLKIPNADRMKIARGEEIGNCPLHVRWGCGKLN